MRSRNEAPFFCRSARSNNASASFMAAKISRAATRVHQAHRCEDVSAQLVEVLVCIPTRECIPKRACDRVLQWVLGCALWGTGYPCFDILHLTSLVALRHFPIEELT